MYTGRTLRLQLKIHSKIWSFKSTRSTSCCVRFSLCTCIKSYNTFGLDVPFTRQVHIKKIRTNVITARPAKPQHDKYEFIIHAYRARLKYVCKLLFSRAFICYSSTSSGILLFCLCVAAATKQTVEFL